MTHSDKDIRAAKAYAQEVAPVGFEPTYTVAYLAGCEHKQKEVDELVRLGQLVLDKIDRHNGSEYAGVHDESINEFEKLIQKHKR